MVVVLKNYRLTKPTQTEYSHSTSHMGDAGRGNSHPNKALRKAFFGNQAGGGLAVHSGTSPKFPSACRMRCALLK
jgi:hypothetical protein